MRRRTFLLTPLLAPLFVPPRTALAAAESAPLRYPAVRPGVGLTFPRDHGAHPEFRTEWWYVTGVLQVAEAPGGVTERPPTAAPIGFQLTFFRTRPGLGETLDSPLAPRQILFAHAAVSRTAGGLVHAEQAGRAGLGAGFATTDADVYIGHWLLRRKSDGGDGADERLTMSVRDAAFAFDLIARPTQPLLLQGERGYSRKGPRPEQASYYVSWPQLSVSGQLVTDGKRQAVTGQAWFDHEWSSEVLGPGSVGWDWIGINLADGGALMAFRIRNAAGDTVFAHARLRHADGRALSFGPDEVRFAPLRHWQSPVSGARYPVEIEIGFGAHRVRTVPLFDAQEIRSRRPRPVRYWEGLVTLEGSLNGRGYLEMTGYAAPLAL